MMPCRIISTGTVSRRANLMVRHLHRKRIIVPLSLTNFSRGNFSSRSNGERRNEFDTEDQHESGHQLHQKYQDETTDHCPNGLSSHQQTSNHRQPHNFIVNETSKVDNQPQLQSSRKKWRAPFWVPPPPMTASSSSSQPKKTRNRYPKYGNNDRRRSINRFRDARLTVRQHLGPNNSSMDLPTSDWVHIFGSLPMTSLEEVLDSIENILRKEAMEGDGIVDLDAEWNPHCDGEDPPLVPSYVDYSIEDSTSENKSDYVLDKVTDNKYSNGTSGDSEADNHDNEGAATIEMESFRVVKAHVVLSPFGRPTGWNLKLVNPSMVNALLSVARNARVKGSIRIGWKFAQISEHHPSSSATSSSYDPTDTRTMLVVNDSMVRFENCPSVLTEDHLRHMLSRYELTQRGSTILRWQGQTNDGRIPPLTYVVRFASPANARAAVREMQGKILEGKPIKLIQYPRQLL